MSPTQLSTQPGMSESSSNHREGRSSSDEEALLQSALADSDRLLRDSLREDDRRRRSRNVLFYTLIAGGIVMGSIVLAFVAGLLSLAPPPVAQAEANKADQDAWVKRIVGLRDHMHTAFGVGPDLTLLDPGQGLEIVRAAWPKITQFEVKTGLLKTFAFSKALPNKHPKVLQVLDLGMNDKNAKVREYAASYVEEYSGKNFKDDLKGYKAWYKANSDKDPNELLKVAASAPKPVAGAVADKAAWVKRIVGLRDHMHTAFGVGPDITLLDPEEGLEVVRAAWPKVTRFEVKTGLLKTFAFSKALPDKHPKVLQVLDLGMNDKSSKVREYAASYVEEYSGKNFKDDLEGYKAWYKANSDKDPNELLKVAASAPKPEATAAEPAEETVPNLEKAKKGDEKSDEKKSEE